MSMEKDYPIDIYILIFKLIPRKDFPLIGCYNLSQNARKAIDKLEYNCCTYEEDKYDSQLNMDKNKPYYGFYTNKLIGKKDECSRKIICCSRCQSTFGLTCDHYTYDHDYDYHMTRCSRCRNIVCRQCIKDCGYCSDPAGIKQYSCKDCYSQCSYCKKIICQYCGTEDEFCYNNKCEQTDKPFHPHCLEKHKKSVHGNK
jgi:hypothetical protein